MSKIWDVSEDEFRAKLSEYTADDYLKGVPHQYHASLMQCDYHRYYLYSSILIEDALDKRVDWDSLRKANASIRNQVNKTAAILEIINHTLESRIPAQKVGILPIMCGNGKSSAITQKILSVIKEDNGHGLIVVTDSVDRLNEYVHPSYNDILCAFLDEHKDRYTLMYAETLLEANKKQHSTPVLLMTTQRYFALSPEEIRQYTRWDGGLRDTIIIDEHPPLREVVRINLADLHTVASALVDGIGDAADQNEKMWCIQEWKKVQERFYRVVYGYESRYPEKRRSYFFYSNPERSITTDDERFLRFISDNESAFKRYKDGEANRVLKAMRIIECDGAIFQSQKGTYYGNTFSVLIDHREMLTDVGAKVLILDGTARIHPDYKQDYIHCPILEDLDYRYIERSLEMLSLNFVNFPTSKSRIVRGDGRNEWKKGIMSYLDSIERRYMLKVSADGAIEISGDSRPHNPKEWPIFTYKELEDYFRRNGYRNTEHFGNIKGRNDFREHDMLVQIGLHRFDPLYYLTYALYSMDGMIERFRNMTQQQCTERIETIIDDPHSCEDIMYPMILEDIEQNFFRGAIRSDDEINYQKGMWSTYWVFCDTKENRALIDLAVKRYEDLYAIVQVIDNPVQKKHAKSMARKSKKPTAYQAVCRWLEEVDTGRVFKRADILQETGFSIKAYEEMLRKHPEIKTRFENMAVEGKKHVYKKN